MHVGPPTQTRKGLFSSSLNSDIIRALFRVPGLQVKRYASDKVSAHERNGDNQAQEPGWEGRKKGFDRDLAHTKK